MLDRDLAQMYGVETKVLNQAVRRNLDRFPEDFMFMLTSSECKVLEISMRSQFVTSKMGGILTIEQSGKDNAEAISDLSDDIQKELDDIYLALSQLAAKQKENDSLKERQKIGFKK